MPYLRAIRQPRPRWIVIADHAIPPAAPLAMAQHARAHIVKVDASQLSMIPTRSGDSPDRRRRPQHQLKGERVVTVAETGKESTR